MTHYICDGGCRGVLNVPGTCQAKNCPKYTKPLQECACKDGIHHGAFDFPHEHEKSMPVKEGK